MDSEKCATMPLLEKLRKVQEINRPLNYQEGEGPQAIGHNVPVQVYCKEAADEIERLRGAIKSISEWDDEMCSWLDAGVRARGVCQNTIKGIG